jgi:hypothetical protein
MKSRIYILSLVLSAIPVTAVAQCSSARLKPIWDADKGQFRCTDPSNPGVIPKDDSVQPTGDKEYCASARDNLQAACPPSNEGKACRNQAKSIYNACYKRAKSDSDSPRGPSSSGAKTDSATCMTTFQQQQQACNSRRLPPPAPGQPNPPDTCLQDALAAQSRCLANSR